METGSLQCVGRPKRKRLTPGAGDFLVAQAAFTLLTRIEACGLFKDNVDFMYGQFDAGVKFSPNVLAHERNRSPFGNALRRASLVILSLILKPTTVVL